LDGDGQFLDLVLAVGLRLGLALFNKFLLLVSVDVGADDRVVVAQFPKGLGSLSAQDLVIESLFLIVVLQVTVRHNVVLSLRGNLDSFACDAVLLGGIRALAGRLEVVIFLIDVADDVVVHHRVLARAEVPRFLLRVVRAVLQSLQLVVEVEDVVSLLVTQRFILVLCECFDHAAMLNLLDLLLARRISEGLRDRVVLHFLSLHVLVRHLAVRILNKLQILF